MPLRGADEAEILSDEALKRNTRLSARLVLNAVLVVLAMGLFYGAYHVWRLRDVTLSAAQDRLELRAMLYTERIASVFQNMQEDASALANYPPVSGLIRIDAAGTGADPLDGSTADDWQRRLAILFRHKFLVNRHYTQVRLILAEDGWRERVRVNRVGEGTQRTPESELQWKGEEPYLARVQADPETPGYFSDVTVNREHGQTSGPVTIRYIHPIRTGEGRLFGVIVINADYEKLLHEARPRVADGSTVIAVNGHGDHVTFYGDGRISPLRFHDAPGFEPLPQSALLAGSGTRNRTVTLGDELSYALHLPDGLLHPSLDLSVITLEDAAALRSATMGLLFRQIGLALLLGLFAGAITHLLAAELVAKLRDITERLRTKSARLSWILGNAADGLITIRADGIIEHVNPAAEQMFGYPADEMVGQPLTMLMPADSAATHDHYVQTSTVDESGKRMAGSREIYGRRRDGSLVELGISVARARQNGEVKFIGQVRDITQRRETERQMERLVEELQRSNAELDQFAYVASHDLKAPLRVIQNASQWLEEDLDAHLDEDTRETLDLLKNRAARMENLLNDLLEHSRIGHCPVSSEVVPGTRLVEELQALLNLPVGMTLEVSGPFASEALPLMPLKLVLLNLLSNAIKHHDREDGTVQLSFRPTPAAWEFTVTDDGPGIAPQYHERVFLIFQTLRPRDEVEGSGLGLAMVRKHVEVAGGSIRLISDGTRGTTFTLSWPRQQQKAPHDRGKEDIAA